MRPFYGVSAWAALVVPAFHVAAATGSEPWRDCADCPELVVVPAGSFEMGSRDGEAGRDEGPIRRVRIARPFALARTEVTRAQFAQFVAATRRTIEPGCRTWRDGQWLDDPRADWRDNGLDAPQGDLPVTCVSWIDARDYSTWLSERTGYAYRLPSEAEWEYAAAGGARTAWPWGNNPDNGCAHANLYDRSARAARDFSWAHADCDDGEPGLAPVASHAANSFGLFDMIGNAWEWTQDCYHELYAGAPTDGSAHETADCDRRSVRGGGWMTRPSRVRTSFRGRDPPERRMAYFGFRVARDVTAAGPVTVPPVSTVHAIRRISLRVDDADAVIGLLHDVLGLKITHDGPLASARAREALGLTPDTALRFVTLAAPDGRGTALGLLEATPSSVRSGAATTAIVVFAVDDLDGLLAAARDAGFAASEPATLGGRTGVRGREASIAGPAGVRVLLQELEP